MVLPTFSQRQTEAQGLQMPLTLSLVQQAIQLLSSMTQPNTTIPPVIMMLETALLLMEVEHSPTR